MPQLKLSPALCNITKDYPSPLYNAYKKFSVSFPPPGRYIICGRPFGTCPWHTVALYHLCCNRATLLTVRRKQIKFSIRSIALPAVVKVLYIVYFHITFKHSVYTRSLSHFFLVHILWRCYLPKPPLSNDNGGNNKHRL